MSFIYFSSRAGELKTSQPLDREEEAVHKMTVRALDGGGRYCEADVEITVEDVNDNAPQFSSDLYAITVFENTEIHTIVARLQATDADTGMHSIFSHTHANIHTYLHTYMDTLTHSN